MVDCPCIASVVSPVLQVAEWLAAPIWHPFKYLYNYTTNFKNLEAEVDKLKNTRKEVERKIIAAKRNVEVIYENVEKWQDSAQEMIDKAEQLIKEKEQFIREKANNPRCFKGLCSNFIIHYKQSRKAFKLKRDDIDPLLQKELGPISDQTNPPEIWLRSSENYLAFESRDTTVTNVRGALNDENVHMIGVYGMGGLGKTMLAQEIGRKANEEGLFEDIVLVEVSESPNIQKIQTEIADNLDLKFENESGRAKKLYSRMEGQKILLILDNIWEPLEFEKIGIPCGADRGRNKLLFTTRKLDVLESMGSTNNFGMGILNEEEAWNLFEKMTGDIIQKHGLHSLQKDVCKECGGLPLVISAIAKALRNKSDPSDWKYALQELKGLSEVKYTRFLEKEYTKIALSYKYLSDELKKMFLICSLMENNTSISDLFKHVVCLNILGGVNLTMEGARKRLDKLVHDLKDACLLLDGFESGQFAMHDVIRDVAIVFAHEEYHVFTTRNDVERDWKDRAKLKKCTKISLPGKSTNISQLWPYDLDCPNDLVCPKDLACLDLDYFYMTDMWNSSFEMPKGFFTVMPNLRVLNLVRLQQLPLPSSIHQLTNLQTLCLDGSNIKYIAIIGKLKNLKVLSMRHSYIKEFSTEMDQLTSLRLLDLSDCYHLKVIAPNVILKLFNLEELYLKGCPIQWKIEVLEELKCLSKLAIVELDIQDDKVLPEALFSRELERYKILVGNWRYQYLPIGEHKCLRILKLIFNRTIYLEEFCGIKNVELLCLVKRSKDEDNEDKDERMWMMMRMMMSMRMRMDEDEGEGEGEGESTPIFNKKVIFSDLKVLVLKNIISRKIWDNQLPSSSFQNLKELILRRCTRIKFVFPCSITKDLKQLQCLEIKACIDLEEIVATAEITEAAASFVFPELTFLKLENLPKLATFYPGIHTLECPKLKRLETKSCNKFKIFNSEPSSLCLDYKVHFGDLKVLELKNLHFEKICDSQLSTSSYQNLTHLTLFGCDKIKYVFPLSIAKNLQQLQYLELTSCEVLERIVAPEEGTEATINFFFPQVSTMKLQYLPEFTNLYPGIHTSEWPKLKELVVKDCPKFKMFTSELNSLCLDQKINHDLELFVLKTQSIEISWNRDNKALKISSDESAYIPLPVLQRFQSLERLQLYKCEYKEIKSVFDLPNLNVLALVWCHKLVSPVPSSPSTARSLVQLKELCISNCGMLDVTTIEIVFQKLTKLSFYQLKSRTCFCSGNHSLNFPSLKELIISYCSNMDTFFREISNVSEFTLQSNEITPFFNQKVYFRDLEVLKLENISSEKIWDSQLSTSSYQNLTHLTLRECDKIKYVFPLSIAKSLQQLQYLKLTSCEVLERIVALEEGTEATINFFFPRVSRVELQYLPKLIDFYPGIHTSEWPKLRELMVKDCPEFKMFTLEPNSLCLDQKVHLRDLEVLQLKNISFEKIWDNQLSTSSYQNLMELTLCKCDKIKHVFPLSIAKSLQQLQYLELTSCEVLERIVAPKEGTEATINFFFPQVSTVKLQYLPEFTDFYPRIHTSEWPKLEELVVKDCPKFKLLTSEPNFLCFDRKINHDLEVFKLETQSTMISWYCGNKGLEILHDKSANIPLQLLQRFQTLERLQLIGCEYKEIKSVFDLPNLNVLHVEECSKLVSLVPSSTSLQNLKVLEVSDCNELVNLTTLSTTRSLVQLKELSISNCRMLTKILEDEGDAATCTEIVFNNLNKLSFKFLESLTCFCSGNYSFSFPSLEELITENCPNLEIFCQGSICTPKLDRVIKFDELNTDGVVEIGDNDLNTIIQQECKKQKELTGSSEEKKGTRT